MIKALGERDVSAQETMHLLSLKLYNSSFRVLPVSLDGSCRVKSKFAENDRSTNDSLLDVYAQRQQFSDQAPTIMTFNLAEFVKTFKWNDNKLEKQGNNVVAKFFPQYSSNPKGENFGLYCKYQLLTYKPWHNSIDNAWDNAESIPSTFIMKWKHFLQTPYAEQHVPNWLSQLNNVEIFTDSEKNFKANEGPTEDTEVHQEDWMVLSSHGAFDSSSSERTLVSAPLWSDSRTHYSDQQLGEMANWLKSLNEQQENATILHSFN